MREKEAQIKERLLKNMQEIHGIKVIKICAPIPAESIKNIAFQLRGEITENLCFVAGTINEGKPMLTVMLSDNLVDTKISIETENTFSLQRKINKNILTM